LGNAAELQTARLCATAHVAVSNCDKAELGSCRRVKKRLYATAAFVGIPTRLFVVLSKEFFMVG